MMGVPPFAVARELLLRCYGDEQIPSMLWAAIAMIQQTETSLTVEMPPRRLSQITAVLFVVGGFLAMLTSAIVYAKTHQGALNLAMSVLVFALGVVVLGNTQGVYVVFDRKENKVRGQRRPMAGAKKPFEYSIEKTKRVQLAGTVNFASVYMDFEDGDELDSVLCGQFARTPDGRQELLVVLRAIQQMVPKAPFEVREELEKSWLKP